MPTHSDTSTNFIQKYPHRHTQSNFWPNVWASCSPVRSTYKFAPHSLRGKAKNEEVNTSGMRVREQKNKAVWELIQKVLAWRGNTLCFEAGRRGRGAEWGFQRLWAGGQGILWTGAFFSLPMNYTVMIKTIKLSVVLRGEGRCLKIFHQSQKFL